MNIIVKTLAGSIVARPSTTWDKANDEVFFPDFVSKVSWAPVLFARISKAGRAVSAQFAPRYYDGIGYGVLLYAENLIDGSPEGYAQAICLDHTSLLNEPLYNPITLGEPDNVFVLKKNGRKIFATAEGTRAMIEEAIAHASSHCFLRTGDLLAIELRERKLLCSGQGSRTKLTATYCGNFLLEYDIVL